MRRVAVLVTSDSWRCWVDVMKALVIGVRVTEYDGACSI